MDSTNCRLRLLRADFKEILNKEKNILREEGIYNSHSNSKNYLTNMKYLKNGLKTKKIRSQKKKKFKSFKNWIISEKEIYHKTRNFFKLLEYELIPTCIKRLVIN